MSLIDQARIDTGAILRGQFSVPITLISPDSQVATVRGIHNKTSEAVDPRSGIKVNSKHAAVTIYETDITDDNDTYPIRCKGEVNFKEHKVKVKDSTGLEKTYKVNEWFPDETVGIIVLILGKYAD